MKPSCIVGEACPRLREQLPLHLRRGQVGYASDRLALHTVRSQPEVQSVSLHLYAPPITVR